MTNRIIIATDEEPLPPEAAVFVDGIAAGLGPRALRSSASGGTAVGGDSLPAGVVYISSSSTLAHKCIRMNKLRRVYAGASRLMVHLSPLRETERSRWPRRVHCTDPVLVLSYRSLLALSRLGLRGDVIATGVDTSVFQRESTLARSRLSVESDRLALLWDADPEDTDTVVAFRERDEGAVTVACHAGGPPSRRVAATLKANSISAFDADTPFPALVGAADALVCARSEDNLVVEVPPLIPAALAAGLPVFARPVGGLRDFFEPGPDFHYWNTTEELLAALRRTRQAGRVPVRAVEEYDWVRVASRVVEVLERRSDAELAVPG